ncbi:hypothetical protein ACLRDC_15435 [Gluconacetobacter sacchari]|uniref:hypothetical protein n=1 Tax=Gluconacetobacter sacchari TaxID=92759 RepID=UPI0039B3F749
MASKKPGRPRTSHRPPAADRLFHDMQTQAAHALAADPRNVQALAQEIASIPAGTDPDEALCTLLTMTLDQARMAQEGGQRFGQRCLDAVSRHLADLSRKGAVTMAGTIAIARCYVRAGLPVPAGLEPGEQPTPHQTSPHSAREDTSPEAAFAALSASLLGDIGDDPSILHQTFAEILPGIPPDARSMLCRVAAANPDPRFEQLACAWLLDMSEQVRSAALEGLADRLAAGRLSPRALGRLAVLRSWIVDDPVRRRVDALIRSAIRSGISQDTHIAPSHRIIGCHSSPIDGSGAQSLAIALQKGRSRDIAMVLLKQRFGVKDAYIVPCANAAEQRGLLQQVTTLGGPGDVSLDYVQTALSIALADGRKNAVYPAPGLADVAEACALTTLRPTQDASAQAIVSAYDPQDALASLDQDERETLIAASADWPARYPMVTNWFEDDDDIFDGVKATSTARARATWTWLETRRDFWASIIARTALLLKDQGDPQARSFAVTAHAVSHDTPLQRIPIMAAIVDQTLEASRATSVAGDDDIMALLMNLMAPPPQPAPRQPRDKPARKRVPRKPK